MSTPPPSSVRVRRVQSRSERNAFVDFPYGFYDADGPWIAPLRQDVTHTLDPKKNAFFAHGSITCFLAYDAQQHVVGRIAAIVNGMHLQKYNDGVGFFGFFECVDDSAVATALLDAAADWLRMQGLTAMRGPTNPSLNDTSGLLVDGFDREPSILMPYNPPTYVGFLTDWGMEQVMTMWAYYVHKKYVKLDKLRRGAQLIHRRNPNLEIRQLDMDRFEEDAQTILHIYNDAWSNNWGHVPMTKAEFDQLAKNLKQVIDPRIVFILEDNGQPVAFSIALPNLNQALRHVPDGRLFPFGLPKLLAYGKLGIYECRMPLMGVLQSHQGRGYDALVILETIEQGPGHGYDACEMSWVLDSNHKLKNAVTSLGGVVDKQYGMFEKPL